MAAEQKAVESTAADQPQRRGREFQDRQGHLERTLSAEVSETIRKEDRSVTDHTQRDHAGHSEKVAKGDHSATDHAGHSEKDPSAEVSERDLKEDHSERESRSATDHADHSERVLSAEVSENVRKGRTSESALREGTSGTESLQDQDSTQAARASTERTSIISVTRTRAESAR